MEYEIEHDQGTVCFIPESRLWCAKEKTNRAACRMKRAVESPYLSVRLLGEESEAEHL